MAAKPVRPRIPPGAPPARRIDLALPLDLDIRVYARSRREGIRKTDLCLRLIESGMARYREGRDEIDGAG